MFEIVIVLLAWPSSVSAQLPPQEALDSECPSFQPPPGKARRVLFLPDPLTSDDISRYSAILLLSEEQTMMLQRGYVVYCSKCLHLKKGAVEGLWARAAELGHHPDTEPQEFESLFKDREHLVKELTSLDSSLIQELIPALSDDQQMLVPLVQADRAREICGALAFESAIYPEARIDILQMVLEAELTVEHVQDLTPVLLEYSQAIVPQICMLSNEMVDTMVKDAWLVAQLKSIQSNDSDGRQRIGGALIKQREELMRPQIRAMKRVRDTNRAFVQRVTELLPAESKHTFEQKFREKCYPKLYPDSSNAEFTIGLVLAIDDLSDEQLLAIEALAASYRQSYKHMCSSLEEHITKWNEVRLGGGEVFVHEIEAHEAELNALKAKRAGLQFTLVKQMMDILTPEQKANLPAVRSTSESAAK